MKLTITDVPITSKIKIYQNDYLLEWFRGGDINRIIKHVDITKPIRIEVESSLIKRVFHPVLLPLMYLIFDYSEEIAPYHSVYRITMMPQEIVVLRLNRKTAKFDTKDNLVLLQNDCYLKKLDFLMCIALFAAIDMTIIYICHAILANQHVNSWVIKGVLLVFLLVSIGTQYQDLKQLYRLYQYGKENK
ncbi:MULTISPECIES: hypothetical protein [unclassified Granulicatella]|uniref:hypothetical protein n=1 Tax=unclassified Granulicatella TaxID=2630493 RepID=UPI00107464A8|nr:MULTISPECIES: hypothetical protein [unclassified Granulicatella]MBF0779872.1 hypothetical protein [Granulicatella sp. 19428wC4_WM01]TFU96076.1 hypothetical protein E4T68_02070 [Granulicatella sp. WM01]